MSTRLLGRRPSDTSTKLINPHRIICLKGGISLDLKNIVGAFVRLFVIILLGFVFYLVFAQIHPAVAVLLFAIIVIVAVVQARVANETAITALEVTIIAIFIGGFIAIVASNLDVTSKEIGTIANALAVYAIYNELDKRLFSRAH
jgi:ABC-type iron transport system FetAB permease component